MNKAIIAVLGQDRPGIVASVSRILFEQDCNIENVSQSALQLIFAGIFIVSMPADLSAESLHRALASELEPMRLDVHITLFDATKDHLSAPQSEPFIVTTRGPDRKGLVAGISEVIARFEGNITNLQAIFKGGKDPGEFIMIYEVDVPLHTDQQTLYKELNKRAHELELDIDIQHRNVFEAIHRI